MTNEEQLYNFINNKRLLIVGGSSDASNKSFEWYESFDVIVRLNNYKSIHNHRTDIFFSYFGKNIKKSPDDLQNDGVKFLINKCPNSDMSKSLQNSFVDMQDYKWIYKLRKNWWFCPLISITEKELLTQIVLLDGYMPTVGLSSVLYFILRMKQINIIGFDCFKSNIHNLNEPWDNSGNHVLEKEELILQTLVKNERIIWNK